MSHVMCNSAGWCDICYIIASKVGVGGWGGNLNCANIMLKERGKLLLK